MRRDQGLPLCCPRAKQTVPASLTMDPPHTRVEPISEAGGTSLKKYLRKGKMLHGSEEWREKKCEKQFCEHQGQRRKSGRCSRLQIRYSPAAHEWDHGGAGEYVLKELWPVETPHWRRFILKDCSLWEQPPCWSREKCEEEGAAEMKCYELTTIPIAHPPCAS